MDTLRRLNAEEVALVTLALEEQAKQFECGEPSKFGHTAAKFRALADRFNAAPFIWHGTAA